LRLKQFAIIGALRTSAHEARLRGSRQHQQPFKDRGHNRAMTDAATFFRAFLGMAYGYHDGIYFARPDILDRVKTIIVRDRGFSLIYGMASIILGLASVLLVHSWGANWHTLITIFGWLALLKGITAGAWPEVARKAPYQTRVTYANIPRHCLRVCDFAVGAAIHAVILAKNSCGSQHGVFG
jgi:hypothetical protein